MARAHPVPTVPADASAPADPEEAAAGLGTVFADVASTLQARADVATGTLKDVLSATALMAQDAALAGQAAAKVREGVPPSRAVHEVAGQFIDMFTAAGGYMAERATDLASVRDRVIARLEGLPEPGVPALARPSIVVAEDLSPADTAVLDLAKVLGIVIEKGGPTSHTAIIAGQLGLPCVVRAPDAADLVDGDEVAVDAAHGTVILEPDDAVKAAVVARRAALATLAEDTADGATSDGHGVRCSPTSAPPRTPNASPTLPSRASGCSAPRCCSWTPRRRPTEDDQAAVYARALTALGERKVVIRTLDAGRRQAAGVRHPARGGEPRPGRARLPAGAQRPGAAGARSSRRSPARRRLPAAGRG